MAANNNPLNNPVLRNSGQPLFPLGSNMYLTVREDPEKDKVLVHIRYFEPKSSPQGDYNPKFGVYISPEQLEQLVYWVPAARTQVAQRQIVVNSRAEARLRLLQTQREMIQKSREQKKKEEAEEARLQAQEILRGFEAELAGEWEEDQTPEEEVEKTNTKCTDTEVKEVRFFIYNLKLKTVTVVCF